MRKITGQAPATVANVIVGFDILSFAMPILSDKISVSKIDSGVNISSITGLDNKIPLEPEKNTAGNALLKLIEGEFLDFGFQLEIQKGIPLGSGLGGSAASAVAAVIAANEFLDNPLSKADLFKYALHGESVSSNSIHADNVAACLFGGLNLSYFVGSPDKPENFKTISLPFPESLSCIVVHPKITIETRMARELLSSTVSLSQHVEQSMNLSMFLTACFKEDYRLLKIALNDVVIEPQRSKLIPKFDVLKKIADEKGALGFSISGAGPTMFAWCDKYEIAEGIRQEYMSLQDVLPYEMEIWITHIDNQGASIIKDEK